MLFKKNLYLFFCTLFVFSITRAQTTAVFVYTSGVRHYTVPTGYTMVSIDARGANGGELDSGKFSHYHLSRGGYGARVVCSLAVSPGQVLDVNVGGNGMNAIFYTYSSGWGYSFGWAGWNGGGSGYSVLGYVSGGGGGGGTDIRAGGTSVSNRVIVAGGGGGAGGNYCYVADYNRGGDGGGLTGESAYSCNTYSTFYSGSGGTQTAGGAAAASYGFNYPGSGGLDTGGAGSEYNLPTAGGGGGGGYYGGGGGYSGGGGGGSSYADPTLTTSVIYTQGYNTSGLDSVIIRAICSAGIITGIRDVCVGYTTALSDTTAGGTGTWTSSNTSIATVGYATGIVSGISAGTASITYSAVTFCGATYSAVTVTVDPMPTTITGTTIICAGSATVLSDAVYGGTWSSSSSTIATVGYSSGIVTGVSLGTTTITYSVGISGSCIAVTTVTVNPAPAAITGTPSICIGSTTLLSDATGGGTWTSSNTSVATVSSTGFVSSISVGTSVISYTNSSGCAAVDTVSINPMPLPITGIISVCAGTTSSLTDAGGGTWSSSNTAVATIGFFSGVAIGLTAGTSTITYSLPTGCFVTTIVTVNLSPSAITGIMSICLGYTSVLSDAGGGTWSSSATSVATIGIGSGIVTSIAAGTTTITYRLSTGCSVTTTVTVHPVPSVITGATGLCAGTTTGLSSATGGGIWSSSTTTVATISSSGIMSGISAGTSVITYKIFATGCIATTTVTVSSAPGAITGIAHVCAGLTTSLTDAVAGGTWSSSSTVTASVGLASGLVTGVAPGTATITYSLGAGCASTKTVTVYASSAITGTTTICTGQTTALSNSVSGGVWSSGATSVATIGASTGIVTGLSAGTATVTYLLLSGCMATITVTVNSLPPAITGNKNVCPGSTTILSDPAVGGAWSPVTGAIVSVGSLTGIVTGVTTGTATITYSLGSGCIVTAMVTVNPLPGAISGSGSVCVGASAALSDVGAGTWTSDNTSIAVAGYTTGIVTGMAAGTATITYTPGTGCAATKIVTVNPLPSLITGTMNVCTGSTTALSTTTTGGTWSTTYGAISTVNPATGVVIGVTGGTAIITYSSGAGCITTATVTVSGPPVAITGPLNVCAGSTIILSDLTPGGTWSSSNTTIATIDVITGILAGISGGLTNVTYMLGSGCLTTKIIIVNPISPITGPAFVCVGATITLSDAATGGTWSSPGYTGIASVGRTSGIVAGIVAGTALITYQSPTGCVATAPITVNALPYAGVISGTSNICIGSTITLSDAITGGSWSSTDPVVAVGFVSGDVTGLSTGTATISYSVTNLCGTAIVTHTVAVNSLPYAASIAGVSSVCAGVTVTLSDSTAGGVWSSPDLTVSVGSLTGSVTGIANGTATVSYTYTNLCGSMTATYAVTINPRSYAGVIGGAGDVCVGARITLTDAVTGGAWVATNAHATISGGVVTGIKAGPDTILYVYTNVCGTDIAVHLITVNPLPDAGMITGAGSVCAGTTIALTDVVGGGVWIAGGGYLAIGSVTGIVTGITAGVSVASYSVSNMCGTDVALHTMTVNPQPDACTIMGAGSVCAGVTITLTDSATGGVWSGTAGGGSAVVGSATGILTGMIAGIDTIKYAVTNKCGTAVASYVITVNPQPDAGMITGAENVCVGTTITLSDDVAGGLWLTGSANIAVGAGGIVEGLSIGTAIVTYNVSNMCGGANATLIINVLTLPTVTEITGIQSVCQGSMITLIDTTRGGMWHSSLYSSFVLVGSTTGVVTGILAGSDTVMFTLSNYCGTATASKVITVNPLPDAGTITGKDSVCAGDTVSLSGSFAGGAWGNGNSAVAGLFAQTNGIENIIGITPGTDTLVYTVANSCGSASAVFPFTVRAQSDCPGQVKQDSTFECSGNGELLIYPNPNPGSFTIKVFSNMQESVSIVVVNMLGQKLKIFTSITNTPLDMELNEPRGVYVVKMYSAHGKCSKKMTIVR